MSGTLSGKVSIRDRRPDGTAAITLSKGSAWNEAIDSLTVNAESRDGAIHSTLKLQLSAGTISAEGNYTLATQQYDVKLHGSKIKLDKIDALQKRVPLKASPTSR